MIDLAPPPPPAGLAALPRWADFRRALEESPSDVGLASACADWLAEHGATDADVTRAYALPVGADIGTAFLAAWDCVQAGSEPAPAGAARRRARAAAVRGLYVKFYRSATRGDCWQVGRRGEEPAMLTPPLTEPAARLALKRAALGLWSDVRIPCRAEGRRRMSMRPWGDDVVRPYDPRPHLGLALTPGHVGDAYYLDGIRVGGPPGWAWTPWRVSCGRCEGAGGFVPAEGANWLSCRGCGGSGARLLVTWECEPAGLLPAEERPPCADCGGTGFIPQAEGGWRATCRSCDGSGYGDETVRQRGGPAA